jgi:hypothetical protein
LPATLYIYIKIFFVYFFSLTIKDKTNISLKIKILHLRQGGFTRKVRNKYGLIQTDATNEIVVYSFLAWLITESITMHSVHLPFQCSKVYRLQDQQKNQENLQNFCKRSRCLEENPVFLFLYKKKIIMKKKNSPKFASSLFDYRPFPIWNLKLKEFSWFFCWSCKRYTLLHWKGKCTECIVIDSVISHAKKE